MSTGHDHQQPQLPTASNRPRPDADLIEQPLNDDDQVSGTDIAGDETNVRTREGVKKPGIAGGIPPRPDDDDTEHASTVRRR